MSEPKMKNILEGEGRAFQEMWGRMYFFS